MRSRTEILKVKDQNYNIDQNEVNNISIYTKRNRVDIQSNQLGKEEFFKPQLKECRI